MRWHEAETDVKGDLAMTSRQNGERTRVLIVEQDLDFGMKLADWLATHGYQPVFVRTVQAAIGVLSGFRPQAIFFGLGCSELTAQIDRSEVLLLIQTVCPCVPVIGIAGQTSEDLTQVLFRQGVRRFLVKPVEFSQIGEVLQSELRAPTVEVASYGIQ
jgi:DNA-binding NtrC family response regulator